MKIEVGKIYTHRKGDCEVLKKKLQYGTYIATDLPSYQEALSDFKGNWLREDLSVEGLGHTYKYPSLLSFSVENVDSEKLICNWTDLEYLKGVINEIFQEV